MRERVRPDLHIYLSGRRRITAQIYRQIRDAILDGRLRGGEALPSSRALARKLEISRTTVVEVYRRLRAEGFVESRVGDGTFVRAGLHTRAAGPKEPSPIRPRPLWADIPAGRDLAALDPEYDFRPGIPDADAFPYVEWRTRLSRQMRSRAVGRGAHIGAAGHPDLRAAVARHLGVSRGVRTAADDVFITSGSQQAVDLVARVLLEPGDVVAVEDPGYPLTRRAFRVHGCRVVGVPVDREGLVVDAIPEDARLVYVTPSHQYPLGMAMSMGRRQALLSWAEASDGMIVEDDYDSAFRYSGRPLETLQALDGGRRVLYVGSLSKVLLPTLRLGFAVVPASIHAALAKAKYLTDWHTTVPLQAAAAEFVDDGLLARHVRRMRSLYAERHERITAVLDRDLADRLEPVTSHGGLHLAAWLRSGEVGDDAAAAERAGRCGVAVFPLSYHYRGTPARPGLLLGYGAIPSDRIEEGLRRLGSCL